MITPKDSSIQGFLDSILVRLACATWPKGGRADAARLSEVCEGHVCSIQYFFWRWP